jgi:hypothetical protein
VAIGGIGPAEAARVGAIADAAAVIGALLPEGAGHDGAASGPKPRRPSGAQPSPWAEIAEKARALHAAVRGEERAS